MHLTLRQIQIFEAVARQESHTRAAEKLHMTQPAVSMQIRQLEQYLGIPLFERRGRRMCLTHAGRELLHYAGQVLHAYNDLQVAIEGMQQVDKGHLAVAVTTTANHFATKLLADFTRQHEGVTVTLDVSNRRTLLEQLENGEPDLVIMGEAPKGYNLQSEPLIPNPLVVIASPGHTCARQTWLHLEDIMSERFVIREQGSGTRTAIEKHLHAYGYSCQTSLEMRSNETIKHAVEAGLGLGIVPLHTIQPELDSGRLRVLNVESFPIQRYWHIVIRKGKRLSPVAQAFRDFVRQSAGALAVTPVVPA
ncbi:MAG: LysR family transcriptional regulator [Thiothrix sp.]|nr:LysR family transcriptional regulator [Thiothrix sp.]